MSKKLVAVGQIKSCVWGGGRLAPGPYFGESTLALESSYWSVEINGWSDSFALFCALPVPCVPSDDYLGP